jgi:hypothetical protein
VEYRTENGVYKEPHVEWWDFFGGIVGKESGDVAQALHIDMEMPMHFDSFYGAIRGCIIPPEDSYRYGWAVHLPICRQDMRLWVMMPDEARKEWVLNYVEIPFGTLTITRMEIPHSGFFSGGGRKGVHGVLLPVREEAVMNNLVYFKDFLMDGVFRPMDENDKGYDKDCPHEQYVYSRMVESGNLDKGEVRSQSLFKDWRVKWDERCQSAAPNEYHKAGDSAEDSFGKQVRGSEGKMEWVGGTFNGRGKNEQVYELEATSARYKEFLDKIGMTEEEFRQQL